MNDKMNLLKNITCYNYAVGNHTYLERLTQTSFHKTGGYGSHCLKSAANRKDLIKFWQHFSNAVGTSVFSWRINGPTCTHKPQEW